MAEPWVFFPLGPAVGVLGFLHEPKLHRRVFRPLDFSDRLTLNRGYTALLNLRLWEDAERFVAAHPSDRAPVENITCAPPCAPPCAWSTA